ncbi:MAG TPA: PepSY domain-containing protein [Thermoanaerobaculia bacterium]|jgi:uncharacterized membrane protein YkoI|nr:PepSY domain-containing protein [Thermoanaerobaculia bacterium]
MKMNRALLLACLASSIAMASNLRAAEPEKPAAPAETKSALVSLEVARTTALEKVPGGVLSSEELSRLGRKLIYVFDFRVEGQKGVDVVTVDAGDGTVLEVKHKTEWAARRDAQAKRRKRG